MLDLDSPSIRNLLITEIRSGFLRYVHFGLPCSGWAAANRMNGGTRSKQYPEGGSKGFTHPRELIANRQGEYVTQLCFELVKSRAWFTIENPYSSDFWRSKYYRQLADKVRIFEARIHQCAYGLRPPGFPDFCFCQKDTLVVSNIPDIVTLGKNCPGLSSGHQHVWAWGSTKVGSKTVSLAKSAGHYPEALCAAWAQIIRSQFQSDCPHSFKGW